MTTEIRFFALESEKEKVVLDRGQNGFNVKTTTTTMDQPGKVANPARGQLNKEHEFFPVPVRA